MPLTIILFLFLSGICFYGKRIGKKLLLTSFILLLFFTNNMISNLVMNWWEQPFKEIGSLPEYEIGIVLTGVTNLNKTVYDRTFFNKGADRITHAMQLYKMGKIQKVLITGGQGLNPANTNTEAKLLADFLIVTGVDAGDILIEDKAVNTRENALFSKDLLDALQYPENQTHLLITSSSHMYRAKKCFDKAGLLTETFPVDYYSSNPRFSLKSLLQPDPNSLNNWHRLFKEWIGIIVYKVVGYI